MKLTASIVTYRTDAEELRKCLEMLLRDGVGKVYVIDNSPDEELRGLVETFANASYIPRHDNPGYGAAHNEALRRSLDADSEYHLVLNSDISFGPEVLSSLLSFMDRHPDVGQIQPRIIYPDGKEQNSARLIPTPLDLFGRRFIPGWKRSRRNRRYELADRPADRILNLPYHQGSFMLFRVSALRHVGFFDERFFMYPEDIDMTRRVHELYPTVYYPRVTITHCHRASSYKSLRMLRIHLVNMFRYFNKWGWFHDPLRRRFNRRVLDQLAAQQK